MASCTREPTAEEVSEFTDLASVAEWAKLKGDPMDVTSQAGSMFFTVGAAEDGELCSIAEFAASDPVAFDEFLATWTHSDGMDNTVIPGIVAKGRIRSCLRAARIAEGIDWARDRYAEWEQQQNAIAEAAWNDPTPQSSTAQAVAPDTVTTAINT